MASGQTAGKTVLFSACPDGHEGNYANDCFCRTCGKVIENSTGERCHPNACWHKDRRISDSFCPNCGKPNPLDHIEPILI